MYYLGQQERRLRRFRNRTLIRSLICVLISIYTIQSILNVSVLGDKPVQFIVTDKYGKPLEGAIVTLQTIENTYVLPPTDIDGVTLSDELIPPSIYHVTVKWKMPYHDEPVVVHCDNIRIEEPYIFELKTQVFPLVMKIITPGGAPLKETLIYLNGKAIGYTSRDGQIRVDQVTAGIYEVKTTWLGSDVSPGLVDITSDEVKIVVARNIELIRIRVVGAQGQGLPFAEVLITRDNVTLQNFVDDQGILVTELPIGNYSISVHYKGLGASQNINLLSEATVILKTAVFMELFGASMTFSTFILWIIMVIIVVVLLIIIAQEYNIYRRFMIEEILGRRKRAEATEMVQKNFDKKRKLETETLNTLRGRLIWTFKISIPATIFAGFFLLTILFANIILKLNLSPSDMIGWTTAVFVGSMAVSGARDVYVIVKEERQRSSSRN